MTGLWERAHNNSDKISDNELLLLLNDRVGFVTDNLHTISRLNRDETIFDLVMLFFDSLNEKRPTILKIWNEASHSQRIFCKMQSQMMEAIDLWHQQLEIHWQIGHFIQNTLFFLMLIYLCMVWKEDESADSSKVMAKVSELIEWLNKSKAMPIDAMQKFNELIKNHF